MEPTTIAIAAVSYIALQIAAGGLKEIGKDIYGVVKDSLKPDELIKLNLLEGSPENKELQSEVAEVLAERLEDKPEALDELKTLLQTVNQTSINMNRQEGEGDKINIQGNQNSPVNFNQK